VWPERRAVRKGSPLSIVDATVSARGGAVDIDSEKDRGTTVRLTMPALQ
jgi:signal transduction histidine kinase